MLPSKLTHLLAHHHVAHALCASTKDHLVLLKHTVLDGLQPPVGQDAPPAQQTPDKHLTKARHTSCWSAVNGGIGSRGQSVSNKHTSRREHQTHFNLRTSDTLQSISTEHTLICEHKIHFNL